MNFKAQATILEAFVAVSILALAGYTVAVTSAQASFSAASGAPRLQDALFDLSAIISSGAYPKGCSLASSQSCNAFLKTVNNIYRLSYSVLAFNNHSSSYGNYSACSNSDYECFPYAMGVGSGARLCVYVCMR